MKTDNLNVKPGSLSTWLDYLEGINPDKIELGLSRVKSVYDRLNLNLLNEIYLLSCKNAFLCYTIHVKLLHKRTENKEDHYYVI